MNYYKATEKYLHSYISLKESIKNMQEQIEQMEPLGMSGINYEGEKSSPTFKITSATENEAMDIMQEKELINKCITKTLDKVEKIEKALKILDDIESTVIKMTYFERTEEDRNYQAWEIAGRANCSERWCREKKRIAINKISVMLFGVDVLDIAK